MQAQTIDNIHIQEQLTIFTQDAGGWRIQGLFHAGRILKQLMIGASVSELHITH